MACQVAFKTVRPVIARRWIDETVGSLGSKVATRHLGVIAPPSLSYLPLPAPHPPRVIRAPSLDASLDENLFRYTSGRWLYNESEQMAQRYVKFDVDALHRAIFNICGSPVVGMEKREGLFNKSFMITLADGQHVTARIKNPIAGPKHLMTASEVATMDYVRNYLGVPVPKVLAWSSKAATNGIGAEYIIMETAQGIQLSNVWDNLDARKKKDIVNSIVSTEQKLLDAKFAQYGSLYYKDDISEADRAPRLYADPTRPDDGSEAKFCIGPTANRNFYEDERADMDIERGPWSSPEAYLGSLALREEAWIAQHAKPNIHDDPFRNVAGPQNQEDHLRVLKQYRSIVSALVPKDKKVLSSTLWHPDLNPGNIFVSADGDIVSIIDWQGCWAGPLYLQMNTPSFVTYNGDVPSGLEFPTLPENFDNMVPAKQAIVRADHRAKILHKLYEVKQLYPYQIKAKETRVLPVRAAGRTWKDGILPMQLALLDVFSHWHELSSAGEHCPLQFTRDEVQSLISQRDRYCEWHSFLDDLRTTFGIRLHGWVSPNEYPSKKTLLEHTWNKLPLTLTAEMEAIMPENAWWPFRDTV